MSASIEQATSAKIGRRIVPFLAPLCFVSFLDRATVGFAALTMNSELAFSPLVFGRGAGFFLGCFFVRMTV